MTNSRGDLFTNTNKQKSMKNYKVADMKKAIDLATNIQVVVPQLSVDGVASALALGLTLKNSGKNVTVFSPQTPDSNYNKLAGMDLLSQPVLNQDLTVELSYPMDSIEKVSYDYDEAVGKLKLFVVTKPGSPKVESSQINIINGSLNTSDLSIILGDPSTLGDKLPMVSKGTTIQITGTETPNFSATHKLFDLDAPFSEIITFLIPMLGYEFATDPAKNLLIALRVATQSFAVNVSPESFEAGAIALRASQLGLEQSQSVQKDVAVTPSKPNPVAVS